jgi:Ion channel
VKAISSRRRFSALRLLIALSALIIAFPFVEKLNLGNLIISILFTLVLISGVLAVERRPVVLGIAVLVAVPAVVGRWVSLYWPDRFSPGIFLIGGIIFVLFVVVSLVRSILRAPAVTGDVLCTAISSYLMLGLLWTLAYWLVAELTPNAFSFNTAAGTNTSMKGFNSLYFSFITLATVGYGDITPVTSSGRILAAAEAITGSLYVAILIARLVSLYAPPKVNGD